MHRLGSPGNQAGARESLEYRLSLDRLLGLTRREHRGLLFCVFVFFFVLFVFVFCVFCFLCFLFVAI
jgi:hypothetical protein